MASISRFPYITSMMTPIGLRIQDYRLRRGLTQQELADLASTRQATISDLETGQTQRVDLDLLDRIARALRCKPKDLIGEKGK